MGLFIGKEVAATLASEAKFDDFDPEWSVATTSKDRRLSYVV